MWWSSGVALGSDAASALVGSGRRGVVGSYPADYLYSVGLTWEVAA